jgi:hypothetical protein
MVFYWSYRRSQNYPSGPLFLVKEGSPVMVPYWHWGKFSIYNMVFQRRILPAMVPPCSGRGSPVMVPLVFMVARLNPSKRGEGAAMNTSLFQKTDWTTCENPLFLPTILNFSQGKSPGLDAHGWARLVLVNGLATNINNTSHIVQNTNICSL